MAKDEALFKERKTRQGTTAANTPTTRFARRCCFLVACTVLTSYTIVLRELLRSSAGRFRKHEVEIDGRDAIRFEDVGKKGHFLVARHKKLTVIPETQLEEIGGKNVSIWFIRNGLSDPEAVSFESAYDPETFICHAEGMGDPTPPQLLDEDGDTLHVLANKVMHVVKPGREIGVNQKVTGTGESVRKRPEKARLLDVDGQRRLAPLSLTLL